MSTEPGQSRVYRRSTIALSLVTIVVGAVLMTTAPKGGVVQLFVGLAVFILGGAIVGVAGIRARRRGTLGASDESNARVFAIMTVLVPLSFIGIGIILGTFEIGPAQNGNWLGLIASALIILVACAVFAVIRRSSSRPTS
ncbi:hypothetical protein B7R21_19155 [Subtercola boreus]|uniref:Uncharacterized protein n=1 Tax=Subtercola boreus TaxID=120213 RepID=A0A3E0VAU8_9MICO|nr:hypothetical protein [Subtercola boreus]RFA06653.1 hypothetical protein B7R21_19155 [Subtercola boreus]